MDYIMCNMKYLVLVSLLAVVSSKPTTVVNFGPSDASAQYDHPVAAGFAYAFRAPTPLAHGSANLIASTPNDPTPAQPMGMKTQYHSQDELGQYAFGYASGDSMKHEVRTADGAVRGSYTYLDGEGQLQTAHYVADASGFRVESTAGSTGQVGLPQVVQDTPEVVEARAKHLAAVAAARRAVKRRTQLLLI